jgi:hypothetical protein
LQSTTQPLAVPAETPVLESGRPANPSGVTLLAMAAPARTPAVSVELPMWPAMELHRILPLSETHYVSSGSSSKCG